MLFVKIMRKIKKIIIQCIYLFFIFTFSYASENYLMKNFNNNSNLGEDSDFKDANYIPSIQVPLNDKSQQKFIKDILLNEKLLFQWSKGLPDKFSGHYWVLMANENKRPILVDIVKIEQKNTIQFPNAVMEIFINKKQLSSCFFIFKEIIYYLVCGKYEASGIVDGVGGNVRMNEPQQGCFVKKCV